MQRHLHLVTVRGTPEVTDRIDTVPTIMRLAIILIILFGLLGLSALWNKPLPRADLTVSYLSIETLDPQTASASADIRVAYALFQGLTTYNPHTFTIEPGVAETWNISDDGLTYTFHLWPDAKWSNGDPVTAHDFVNAWRQGMMPDIANPYSEFLFFIRGARAYHQWCSDSLTAIDSVVDTEKKTQLAHQRITDSFTQFDRLVGVKAIDELTLVVELEAPLAYFIDIAAMWPLFPLHRSTIEEAVEVNPSTYMLRRDPCWTRPGRLISNGPYRLTHWRFKREIRLEANEHFHDAPRVGPRVVSLVNFRDANTEFMAYETGAIDLVLGTAAEFRPDLIQLKATGKRDDVHCVDAFGTYYFSFNCMPKLPDGTVNPFADVRVRKAFAMTIDKSSLVRNVTRMNQNVLQTFIPPGSIAGYESPEGIPCMSDAVNDAQRKLIIDQAKQLLSDAGNANGEALGAVRMAYNTGGGHENQVQAIADMWRQHLGVDVVTEAMEWKVFLKNEGSAAL